MSPSALASSLCLPLFALAFAHVARAGEPTSAPAPAQATPAATPALPPGMKTYWFVMLKKGPKRDQSAEEAGRLQAGHMANMQAYADRGQLQIAGPFMDDGDWRGIFILDVPDRAGAEAMCHDDPAVQAGRLACEIHPWLSQKGATLK